MKGIDFKRLSIATLFGLFVGAITYWIQPIENIQILTSNIPYIWSFGSFFGSIILMFLFKAKAPKIALLLSFGVVLAVLSRIVYDIIFWDNTSHNLAPFEIILCAALTLPSAFIGAYVAFFIKKLKK